MTNELPYVLLWLALGMAMFTRVRWGWPVFTGLSVVIAVIVGIVEWAGLAVIALFAGACVAATRSTLSTRVRVLAWGTLVVCALVLADHAVPWINNVLVFDTVALSPSAEPYTLYWNYDKAFVGVLLFAVCVQPQRTIEWSPAITATAVIAGLTAALVAVSALTVGVRSLGPELGTGRSSSLCGYRRICW